MKVVNIIAMMLLAVCFVTVGCNSEPSSTPIPTDNGEVENKGEGMENHPEGTDADGNPVEGEEAKEEAAPAAEEEAAPAAEEEAAPAAEEEAAPAKEEAAPAKEEAAPAAEEAKKE